MKMYQSYSFVAFDIIATNEFPVVKSNVGRLNMSNLRTFDESLLVDIEESEF